MKYDLHVAVRDLRGEPVEGPSIAELCTNALLLPPKAAITVEASVRRFQIALRLAAPGEIELDAKDIVIVKGALSEALYGPLVIGRVDELLEQRAG